MKVIGTDKNGDEIAEVSVTELDAMFKEIRAKAIDEFAETLKEEYVFEGICRDDISKYEYENKIDIMVKQLKAGGNSENQ